MILDRILQILPLVAVILALAVLQRVGRRLLERQSAKVPGLQFRNQLIGLGFWVVGLLAVLLFAPFSEATRGQLLSLVGILLSAAIALSSTTLLGNTMAGGMLKAVRNFRTGDFIRVGDHFGRVSERGLFHTEIQTEDRELTTLPNVYLVTNPVTVIRSSGTIVSATVSLGYDVPRGDIEACLLEAARKTELTDPFVHIVDLLDFCVVYRVAGLLGNVKRIVSTRSQLRACALDALHGAGIEIVSPSFMNQRVLPAGTRVIPPETRSAPAAPATGAAPEEVIFDKAEKAESLDALRHRVGDMAKQAEELREKSRHAEEDGERERLEEEARLLDERRERIAAYVAERETAPEDRE